MILSRIQKITCFFIFLVIYVLAWKIQSQFLIKGDVSEQMHLARIVLRGGNYVNNFFEINPPLSIFLYMPEILIGKLFLVSHIIGVRIYMFFLASGSLWICAVLIKKLFQKKDSWIAMIFLLCLSAIYLILPLGEFGQRENILIIFTMPYFLLVACRLENKCIHVFLAILIGVLSALGFSLKPFFFIPFVLVESYAIFSTKKFFTVRPENVVIFFFLLFYMALIFIFFNPYLTIVIPWAMKFYYQKMFTSWTELLFSSLVLFSLCSVIVYYLQYKKNAYHVLNTILIFALIGFFLSYLIQRLPWYYHFLPVFSIALLLDVYLFCIFMQRAWFSVWKQMVISMIAIVFFSFPVLYISRVYESDVFQKKVLTSMIHYLHAREFHRPVYFFSAYTAYMVSVFEEAGSYPASRLQCLMWLRGDFGKNYIQKMTPREIRINQFFSRLLAIDLSRNKPDLIWVDTQPYTINGHHNQRVEYLRILKQNKQFRSAWKSYHYLKTMQKKGEYQFAIYQRKRSDPVA